MHINRSLFIKRLGLSIHSSTHRHFASEAARIPYWQQVPQWSRVTEDDFLKYSWQKNNTVQTAAQLAQFLRAILPTHLDESSDRKPGTPHDHEQWTSQRFIDDVYAGLQKSSMSIRLTPHILSLINWSDPVRDPLRRQFIPLASAIEEDHPELALDSLHESEDAPVKGLVHRYPDKVLFLATSVCPVYCRFCTRSYAVGNETDTTPKTRFLPIQKKWEPVFEYIHQNTKIRDVVISGGDTFTLDAEQIAYIGDRLLSMPHIQRIRFASKGAAVCPSRLIDPEDKWTDALVDLSDKGRTVGKSVALHTHFNHPREISWITKLAAKDLFRRGLTIRNQTVLLNGVNNDMGTLSELIQTLAKVNIQPYYVYQGDMVRGLEDLRTPLHEILDLESRIRGTIAGFMTPSFVVDLPGGGGKRLACSFEQYDRQAGVATYRAPSVKGDQSFHYYDPLRSLPMRSAEERPA